MSTDFRIDLSRQLRLESFQPTCRSVIKSVALTVTDADGTTNTEVEQDPLRGAVTFPGLDVVDGNVRFRVDIESSNETVVYEADTTVNISSDRGLDVRVRSVRPVMDLCLSTDSLFFWVFNHGSGTLSWHLEPFDHPGCKGDMDQDVSCVYFTVGTDTIRDVTPRVVPPMGLEPTKVEVHVNAPPANSYETEIVSDEGRLTFRVTSSGMRIDRNDRPNP